MSPSWSQQLNINEDCRRRYERAWQADACPALANHLPPCQNSGYLDTLIELACIEIEQECTMRRRAGERVALADYADRFPQACHMMETVFEKSGRSAPTAGFTQHLIDFTLPTELGNYQLLERIGQGGMGTVYRAQHTRLGSVAAVKVVHTPSTGTATLTTPVMLHFANLPGRNRPPRTTTRTT